MEHYKLLSERSFEVVASREVIVARLNELSVRKEGDRYSVKEREDGFHLFFIPTKRHDNTPCESYFVRISVTETEDFLCTVKLEYLRDNFKYYLGFFVAAGLLAVGAVSVFALPKLWMQIACPAAALILSVLSLFLWNEKESVTSKLIFTAERQLCGD